MKEETASIISNHSRVIPSTCDSPREFHGRAPPIWLSFGQVKADVADADVKSPQRTFLSLSYFTDSLYCAHLPLPTAAEPQEGTLSLSQHSKEHMPAVVTSVWHKPWGRRGESPHALSSTFAAECCERPSLTDGLSTFPTSLHDVDDWWLKGPKVWNTVFPTRIHPTLEESGSSILAHSVSPQVRRFGGKKHRRDMGNGSREPHLTAGLTPFFFNCFKFI